jgi:hypothetical protein
MLAHQLCDATVEFLDQEESLSSLGKGPKFVGENGIVADPGEPIIPFCISISKGALRIRRSYADCYEFPFDPDLFGKQTTYCPGEISEATGISDLANEWRRRIDLLERTLQNTSNETERAAFTMRVNAMRKGIGPLTGMFYGKMPYYIPLVGTKPLICDAGGTLRVDPDKNRVWHVEFWMGGWDADALCGFVQGFVTIPTLS